MPTGWKESVVQLVEYILQAFFTIFDLLAG